MEAHYLRYSPYDRSIERLPGAPQIMARLAIATTSVSAILRASDYTRLQNATANPSRMTAVYLDKTLCKPVRLRAMAVAGEKMDMARQFIAFMTSPEGRRLAQDYVP
jgi:hypothetical protein